ncbi:MAG: ParB/RepB/Spo0J family partition protein [Oscillospiraceae bacterium]
MPEIIQAKFKEELERKIREKQDINRSSLRTMQEINELAEKSNAQMTMLPTDRLIPFENHPFKINENRLTELCESIAEQGMIVPLIVRLNPKLDEKMNKRGYYEIMAGHHRQKAAQMLGLEMIPCFIKNVDDDTASLIVVESNKQRGFTDMLPSELARALKMEYEALKNQGKRTDLMQDLDEILHLENSDKCDNDGQNGTSCPLGTKFQMSERNSKRYIRLTYLIEPLLDLVDDDTIPIRCAIDVSFLTQTEQQFVLEIIDEDNKIDMKKSAKLKEFSANKKLTEMNTLLILSGKIFEVKEKIKKITEIKFPIKKLVTRIPEEIEQKDYENYILNAIDFYNENKE